MTWTNRRNDELRERARRVIPGGMYGHEATHMLPPEFPQFFERAEGARIWDADGNEYIDYMCAFGPNLLGYRHEPVERAAREQAERGDTLTGPSSIMVELAEQFVGMISHADWAMFCKNGSDATTIAMMTARAYARRRKILVAVGSYHGSQPWCTPNLTGTVAEDRGQVVTYLYNDVESLEAAVTAHRGDIAGIFATPFKHEVFQRQSEPDQYYAQAVRRICDEQDALLIIDDVRAGFRIARDCSWSVLGVQPDLSCWGKVLGNGHPISATLGSERAREAARSIFVTGSFWFSAVPMAAALATLKAVRETDYLERIKDAAGALRTGLDERASAYGFNLDQSGPAQMPQIFFRDDPDMRLGFAWTAMLLRHGVYFHPYHNMFLNSAMTQADIALTLDAAERAFSELRASRTKIGANQNALVRARLKLAN